MFHTQQVYSDVRDCGSNYRRVTMSCVMSCCTAVTDYYYCCFYDFMGEKTQINFDHRAHTEAASGAPSGENP